MNKLNKHLQIPGKQYSSVIIKVDSLKDFRTDDILQESTAWLLLNKELWFKN